MQFLYPIFLIAGLSLLIPILIHLFNLRRYKTVFFPHTRFLKSLQLHSRKQSQVRYKWLLLARLLFLTFLILAFGQPYFPQAKKVGAQSTLTAIYIDNSQSMSLRQGQRNLLDMAKENASQIIHSQKGQFLILSNEKPYSYKPLSATQALIAISKLQLSAISKINQQILNELNSMLDGQDLVDLYYFSDFQKSNFIVAQDKDLLKKIRFNGVQMAQTKANNVYIDTAFFESPVLQTEQSNQLIVRTKYFGDLPKSQVILQLSVAAQIKSAATPVFNENKEHYDTLNFQMNESQWQRITLTLNDAQVHFDDTFLIAARSTPELSVLLLNESQPNVFIQAALRSYKGFKVTEKSTQTIPENIDNYNLIIINGLTVMNDALANAMLKTLQRGQNLVVFLGQNANIPSINEGFKKIADIQIQGFDTAAQTVATVQSEHRLVKDMFERMPENVQLPFARNHYQIKAGLSANQQSIFSFRNGDPFFALYSPYKGQLYICATTPDESHGNFQSSYFFVPFLYQMASMVKGNSIYALNIGQKQAIYINHGLGDERNLFHIKGQGIDAIPAQRAEGMGTLVSIGNLIHQAGFYALQSSTLTDSTLIAVNYNRMESDLSTWSLTELRKSWQGKDIHWQQVALGEKVETSASKSTFPLWKLCSILALLMLGIESYLLSKNLIKQKQTITS